MLSGVSAAGPHSPCNYKNNNLSKNTNVQWRAPQINEIKSNTIDTKGFLLKFGFTACATQAQ
jgi:hypothetical protein